MGVAADSYTLLEPRQSAMVDELAKLRLNRKWFL